MTRVIFAYFACILATYLAVSSQNSGGGDGIGAVGAMLFVFMMLLCLLVLPLFIFLRKMLWLAWWQLAIAGSLVMLIPSGFFIGDYESTDESLITIGSLMLMGAIFGLIFWALAIYRNKAFDDKYTRVNRKALKRIFLIAFIILSYFVCTSVYESIKYKLDINWIENFSCQTSDKSIYPVANAESVNLYNAAIEEEIKWNANEETYKSSLLRSAELGNWQAINK